MHLRPATPADLDLVRRWDWQPHIKIAKGDDDWQWEAELGVPRDWREQFIAEVDGRPIGYLEIIDPSREDTKYWGCIAEGYRAIDLWIGEKEALGRGYGTQMMSLAIDDAFADPAVTAVVIDPLNTNVDAHRFYRRLGFAIVGRRMFDEDDCLVMRLERADWEGRAR